LHQTLKGFGGGRTLSGFRLFFHLIPGLSLCSSPGLKLANAFGVFQTEPVLNLWTACGPKIRSLE